MDRGLYSILKPYDNWDNDKGEKENLKAKEALYIFYKELLNHKPSRQYERSIISFPLHTSYIRFLVNIKKAFMEDKYMRVCNELISLMYYESFFQGRIYFNVINLLKENLNIEVD